MNQKVRLFGTSRGWFNINIWLILSSLCCLILFNSCASRSVRNNSKKPLSKPVAIENKDYRHLNRADQKTSEQNSEEMNIDKLDQYVKLIEDKNKNIDFTDSFKPSDFSEQTDESSEARMPTLMEQIKGLSEEQTATNQKVEKMQNDINDIKSKLSQIQQTIDGNKQDNPIKGKPTTTQPTKPRTTTSNIILSNEELENDKKVVKNSSENALAENKSFTIAPASSPKAPEKPIEPESNKQEIQLDTGDDSPEIIYRDAISSFERKDYNSVANKMRTAILNSKDPIFISKCNYWIGEAHYHLQNYSSAIEFYGKTLNVRTSPYRDKAQIMIAESLLRSGNAEKAKGYYQALINEFPNSEYLPKARKMLQQL